MKLPEEFERHTRHLLGPERYALLCHGLEEEPPVSVRLNPFKVDKTRVRLPGKVADVPWCPLGAYLSSRPNFTFDPLLHAGLYYVQEASSMFLHHVVRQLVTTPVRMLDLCAAPGGKSTCAMSALPAGSLLFSNEPMRQRAQILNENILKFGHPDIVVTNNFAIDYRQSGLQFDIILADVPCSGEGMFRKDAGARDEWSLENVEKCRRLQRDIITDIWPALKPGGLLVYSTCTFNAHENEENADWIARELGAEFVEIPTEKAWHITGSLTGGQPVCRFLPGISRGEGLFMAVLRKHGTPDMPTERSIHALQSKAMKRLKVMSHGPLAGIDKGNSHLPDHSEALSVRTDMSSYPQADIDYTQAIAYLRKEALVLPPQTARGIVLLTFRGQPIGFVKNIGNRANNLYPAEWKIKSTHIPDYETILRFT